EEDLEERPDQHRRDVDGRTDPVEERAVGEQPADEEDTEERRHVSERVAVFRAATSKYRRKQAPSARYAAPSASATTTSGHGVPPRAASRIARTPQVGASSHAIGCDQPGSSDSGTSIPVTSSTGHSSMFESAFACR